MSFAESLGPLETFLMLLSFVLGALVGSFCNVCACRWPAGESVVSPRSRCPKCLNPIAWFDNIPIFSWLILGAKCRHCEKTISWQYPLVEGLTGVLFLLVYLRFGIVLATPVYMLFCAAMVVVTFQDLADWTIPDEITKPGIPIALGLSLVGMLYPDSGLVVVRPLDAFLGILAGGGCIYLLDRITLILLKKVGMGFGDVKLLAMIGGFTGVQGVFWTLIAASFLGSLVGVPMILYFRYFGRATPPEGVASADAAEPEGDVADAGAAGDEEEDVTLQGHYLPFGPYLALAGILYIFFGPQSIDWYLEHLTLPPAKL
jgi:leader peptidase (prepilin peptidase)/N-methyltransferase